MYYYSIYLNLFTESIEKNIGKEIALIKLRYLEIMGA